MKPPTPFAHDEQVEQLHQFHDACIKELYRMLEIDGSDGEYRFKWVALELNNLLLEVKKLREENEKLTTAYVEATSQKRPKFSPGAHLINELHRCQNGECSCMWLATEIENYIEEEIEKGLKS